MVLTDDQSKALEKIKAWLKTNHAFFVLKGFSGSGKSFMLKELLQLKEYSFVFTAPTNKATKVLSNTLNYAAKTIYSTLGLRMIAYEDSLRLEYPKIPPIFPRNTIIVIDEASMVGEKLHKAVLESQIRCSLKILYVGDPAQLPPVKENKTLAWEATKLEDNRALLKQIVRYDNNLLSLATDIRNCIKDKNWNSPIHDYQGKEGIEYITHSEFDRRITNLVKSNQFNFETMKIISWTNKTVDRYNSIVRKARGFEDDYCIGDLISLADVVEDKGIVIATVDDEYEIIDIEKAIVNITIADIEVYRLKLKSIDSQTPDLVINIPINTTNLDYNLGKLADRARRFSDKKSVKEAWELFWENKKKFNSVRFSYALTAHRAQGSTYETVFVDHNNILSNHKESEAFRCLYTAVTRASKQIIVC